MDTKIHRTKIARETFSANAAALPVVFAGAKR
jgi:hypothetical protein